MGWHLVGSKTSRKELAESTHNACSSYGGAAKPQKARGCHEGLVCKGQCA